jgi:hypothetical protein
MAPEVLVLINANAQCLQVVNTNVGLPNLASMYMAVVGILNSHHTRTHHVAS